VDGIGEPKEQPEANRIKETICVYLCDLWASWAGSLRAFVSAIWVSGKFEIRNSKFEIAGSGQISVGVFTR
jgi:hypothetical protein